LRPVHHRAITIARERARVLGIRGTSAPAKHGALHHRAAAPLPEAGSSASSGKPTASPVPYRNDFAWMRCTIAPLLCIRPRSPVSRLMVYLRHRPSRRHVSASFGTAATVGAWARDTPAGTEGLPVDRLLLRNCTIAVHEFASAPAISLRFHRTRQLRATRLPKPGKPTVRSAELHARDRNSRQCRPTCNITS